jgi:hypothetical protein
MRCVDDDVDIGVMGCGRVDRNKNERHHAHEQPEFIQDSTDRIETTARRSRVRFGPLNHMERFYLGLAHRVTVSRYLCPKFPESMV